MKRWPNIAGRSWSPESRVLPSRGLKSNRRRTQDVAQIVADYGKWLEEAVVPKLFINAEPGAILVGPQREYCQSWPYQTEIIVKGHHFIRKTHRMVGTAIADWMNELP